MVTGPGWRTFTTSRGPDRRARLPGGHLHLPGGEHPGAGALKAQFIWDDELVTDNTVLLRRTVRGPVSTRS